MDQPHVLSLVKWLSQGAEGPLNLSPTLPPAPALIWGGGDKEEPGVALREEGASGRSVLGPERIGQFASGERGRHSPPTEIWGLQGAAWGDGDSCQGPGTGGPWVPGMGLRVRGISPPRAACFP